MKKLLSIAAILMLAAGGVLAGTINVDVSDPACVSGVGQPDPYAVVYCGIQDAIDDAASGDVINVANGTYGADPATGKCAYITKDGLSLVGESQTGTIIDGAIGGVGSSASYWPKGIHIQANNVAIQNFTVQGFTGDLVSTGGYGVLHRDYAHDTPGEGYIFYDGCSVDHVTVHSCYSVVYALCFTNLTVADCYLHDNYSDGMFIARGSDGAIIHDNVVTNSGDQGIWVGKCWSGLDPSDNATIYNNTVNGAREGGICFVGSDVAEIYNNSITNAASEGWSVGALNLKDGPTNVNAYGNRIFDNDGAWNGHNGLGHGVGIDGSAGNINLHDNAIYGNSGLGVYNASTKASSGTWETRLIEDELPSSSEHMTSWSSDKGTRGLVLAEDNWWGDAGGPYNATTNPSAVGDAVSDDVDYSPWWGADYVDDPHTSPWTWYVNTSNNSTIQEGIDVASVSDVINVTAGTYTITSAIDVNKGVTITGAVGTPANVVVQYNPASTSLNGFEIGAANITIQGFTISDCFRGVHFDRTDITSTGCTITNCVFDNNSENAIGEVAAENTTISNNTMTNCSMGIEIRANEATSPANRTEVTGNTISSCSQSCIQTYLGKYVYIYDNTISSANDKGINIIRSNATGTSDRIQVIGNTISQTKYPGIQVIGAPYTYIYNNTLTQCNYYGADGTGDWDYASIHVQDDIGPTYSSHTIIDGNTVYDGINGIQTWTNDVTITANEIYDMGVTYAGEKIVGSRTYKNSGILVGSNWGSGDIDPTGVVIHGNSIHDNYWGLFYSADLSNGVDAEQNWWGDASGPYNATTNPSAVGDAVSDDVDYSPWWGADYVDDPHTSPWTWYVNTSNNSTIQEGIDAASVSVSDVINVAAGTYREQLYVDHSLDLLGTGIGVSIIEAPDPVDRTTYDVTQWTGSSRTIDAIIGVVAAGNVNISGFTVDGRDVGPNNFYGVHFFDTDGSVTLCEIDNITDAATPSNSRVVSVVATHSLEQTFTIDFSSNSIPVFQKCGILIMGPGATFTVNENTVVNVPSPVIAGNGMQLSYGATGTTYQNVVQGAEYTGDDWAATGILLFESGDISMDGDEVYNCQSGVNFSDWGWVYLHPSPVNLSFTNLNLYDNEWTLGIQLSRDNSDVNMTVTDCDVLNSTGDGIDLYCTGEDPWGGSYYTGWENGDLNATIAGCYVSGTALDGIWGGDYSGNVNNVSVSVFDCMFTGNVGSAINNAFTQIMDASGCYWDDPTGPTIGVKAGGTRPIMLTVSPFGGSLPEKGGSASTGLIASDKGSGETIYGNIDYTPWLGGGSPTSPGFQGDFATLWVDDDSPQSGATGRIQEGIDLVTGSTVNVAAGMYTITSAIGVNKGVTITGDVGTPANVVVQYNPASSSLNGFEMAAANITIQGFTISDCFRGVHFDRTDITSTGCTITNCVFDNNSENAIGEVAAENTTISNNTVTNCTHHGIEIRAHEATSLASRTEVTGNTISSCSQSCIQTYLGKYVYIYGNTISSTNDKGINVIRSNATGIADRIQVIGNTISETKWPGIQVIGAPYTYVYNNTLTQCNYYGADGTGDWDYASIHVQDDGVTAGNNVIVDNNTISDGINGIQTWANDVTVTANEIYDMGVTYGDEKIVGSRTYKNSGILVGSNWGSGDIDPTGVVIQDNSIHDNYWGLFYSADLSNGVDASGNNWGASDGPEDTDGTDEAFIGQCFPVESMLNIVAEFFPTEGLGNAVSDNVNYCPWIPWSCCVVRGDIDHSGGAEPINIADLVYLVDYMFNEGPQPICLEEADMDATGEINIADLVYLVDYMFNEGPEPVPCP